MEKVLHDVKELLEEEIKKITKKGDISANELANLEKAVCLADRVQDMLNDMEGYSEGESYGMHPRNRMIAKLEEMYDTAKTEHEKEVVDKWIKRLETER